MAQERPNWFAEWLMLIRGQLPLWRQGFADWLAAVREEPALIWETSLVRYAAYGGGGMLIVWIVTWVIGIVTPPPPANARAAATTADFHVICSDASCGQHFVIHRPFGFDRFPVDCLRCRRKTGVQARPCHSTTCQGRWVAPKQSSGGTVCPVCGGRFE